MSYIYKIINFLVLAVLFISCGSSDKNNENNPEVNNEKYSSSRSCSVEERSIFKNINAPVFAPTSSVSIYEDKKNVTTISATAKNGGTISYSICGRASEFFNIDSSSGKITFKNVTNNKYNDRSSYDIIVKAIDSNDARATSKIFKINILVSIKPNIQNIEAKQTFILNKQIEPINFVNTGGAMNHCEMASQTLPTGLSLGVSADTESCYIHGTPSVLSSSTEYNITAINTANEENNATVTIEVIELAPNISDTILSTMFPTQSVGVSYINGIPSETWKFANTGGAITSCEINTTIPDGLTLNNDCTITGTPTAEVADSFTIQGKNSQDAKGNRLTVKIQVKRSGLSIDDISGNPELIVGQKMTAIQFGSGDDNKYDKILYCAISPALSSGLILSVNNDNRKCEITGTPNKITSITPYTVTAASSLMGGRATVTIVVKSPPAPNIADITNKNLVAGTKITPIKFTNTGEKAISSCSSTPSLPTGLHTDTNGTTCEISGTAPSTAIALREYNITATSSLGVEDNASIKIAITVSIARLSTGQTAVHKTNDDGTYRKGISRSFTRNTNGVVTDNVTKLEWQDSDYNNTKYTQTEAITHCQDLELDGHTDWELPSIRELSTILHHGKRALLIDSVFQNTKSRYYFSSSEYTLEPTQAWGVNFSSGETYGISKSDSHDMLCVRGRQ